MTATAALLADALVTLAAWLVMLVTAIVDTVAATLAAVLT